MALTLEKNTGPIISMKENIENRITEIYNVLNNKENTRPGLLSGAMGTSIFIYHYARYFKNKEAFDLLENTLVDAINSLDQWTSDRYGDGIAGIGWTLTYLIENEALDDELNEIFDMFDHALEERMTYYGDKKDFDFLHGLVGLGMYFIARKNQKAIAYIIEKLDEAAIEDEHGLKWISTVFNDDQVTRREVYNISMAHGSSAFVSFFCKVIALRGDSVSTATRLLKGAINHILSCKRKDQANTKGHSLFPGYLELDDLPENYRSSRMAWCYGDMGISLAAWQAGEALGDEELKKEAIAIGLHSTKRRTYEETLLMDAGICHGTSGIMQMYNRLHKNTDVKEFEEAAAFWTNKTLENAVFEDGPAGYKSYTGRDDKFENDYGFLGGITGIGLALISRVSDEDLAWDKSLLIS